MNANMTEPRCLIGTLVSGDGFRVSSRAGENGFVDTVKSFLGCSADDTSSRDRDQQAGR
jgi:hypothetical protein